MINSIFDNPFSDAIYQATWLKYFGHNTSAHTFKAIQGVQFVKHVKPYYANVGTNTTNGMVYKLDASNDDYKNKTFLIYDVPSYCDIAIEPNQKLKVKKVKQLNGFATDLRRFESLDNLIKTTFSSGSRKRFKRCFNRLEVSCNITYKTIYKNIDEEAYKVIMQQFKGLIIKRYNELGIDVNLIAMWPFFTELLQKMILEQKAALFIIYSYDKPISMSLVFLNKNTLFNAVKAFDSDYYRFNIGHLDITKIMEWSFDNAIEYVDFSKGEYEYKTRWTNMKYYYDCHILYDGSSTKASLVAFSLAKFMRLKQFLRDKNINVMYSKFKFMFKNKSQKAKTLKQINIEELSEVITIQNKCLVDIENDKHSRIKRVVLDRLYNMPEPLSKIKVYNTSDNDNSYYVLGEKNNYKVNFS